jgi:L-threonylcarbamoyladenylate synthase
MKKFRIAAALPPIIPVLAGDGIGIMPTDTIYGIVGSALRKAAVRRIYRVRRRNPKKPCIILIGDIGDLALFGITIDRNVKKLLGRVWPGKVSVVFRLDPKKKGTLVKFFYLHRGTCTLAFRLPKDAWLRVLLRRTGPLVAPSANYEGMPPARTIREAKKYFGDRVDFYVDAGRFVAKPSTLVTLSHEKFVILRQGEAKLQ